MNAIKTLQRRFCIGFLLSIVLIFNVGAILAQSTFTNTPTPTPTHTPTPYWTYEQPTYTPWWTPTPTPTPTPWWTPTPTPWWTPTPTATKTPNPSHGVWYVDSDNTSEIKNGNSWKTAFTSIQDAVNGAFSDHGGEVWVAEGTYKGINDRVLVMKNNVSIYGGFIGLGDKGLESERNQRDWIAHPVIIDGENTRSCVTGANNAVLDGFIVCRGKMQGAAGKFDNFIGGTGYPGQGAGLANFNTSPLIQNCIFRGNVAIGGNGGGGWIGGSGGRGDGGAIYNDSFSSPQIIN